MKEHTKKLISYRSLIKSGKYYIKELRKTGFNFDSDLSYGNIFKQAQDFSIARYEYEHDL